MDVADDVFCGVLKMARRVTVRQHIVGLQLELLPQNMELAYHNHAGPSLCAQGFRLSMSLSPALATDIHACGACADRGEPLQISASAVHAGHAGALQIAQQRGAEGCFRATHLPHGGPRVQGDVSQWQKPESHCER